MKSRLNDELILSTKYHRLQPIKRLENKITKGGRSRPRFLCICDCGNIHIVNWDDLKSGNTKSCGCLATEVASKRFYKHGRTGTPEHNCWLVMQQRCYDVNIPAYKYYGDKDISVCDRWLDRETGFINFYNDMGGKPSSEHSIDRIDNDGDYEPSNCRWATREEQANNKSNNIVIEYNNESHSLIEWAEILKLDTLMLRCRYNRGWKPPKIFSDPTQIKTYNYKNEILTMEELSKVSGVDVKNLRKRIVNRKWDINRAVSQPLRVRRGIE